MAVSLTPEYEVFLATRRTKENSYKVFGVGRISKWEVKIREAGRKWKKEE